MELSSLQGVEYSYSRIYSEIEPVLLPNILALGGEKHGQNEIFCMLIATVPDLASVVNKKAVIKEKIAENNAEYARRTAEHLRQIAALTSENLQLNKELVSIDSGEKNQPVVVHGKTKRRQRSASF
mmetsp:Transcript_3158/g.5761  ORF Transcript_3158/g.5761 Transcript_3158/m.5761 type:complete len:126 (+) Transcript_3158:247-624(+)